jgi:hypothetical protein
MDLQHCQKELLFVSLSVGNGGKLLARCPSVGISVFEFSLMIREATTKKPVLRIRSRIRIGFGRLDPMGMWIQIRIQKGKHDPHKKKSK